MCVHTPPLRLNSSARGRKVQFKGCRWSFLGASRGCNWGSQGGYNWRFLGASRQGVLLEISGSRGVQLDVFRSLKGGLVELFWSFKGCCWKFRGWSWRFYRSLKGVCSSRFWKNVRSPNQTRYGQDSMCVL